MVTRFVGLVSFVLSTLLTITRTERYLRSYICTSTGNGFGLVIYTSGFAATFGNFFFVFEASKRLAALFGIILFYFILYEKNHVTPQL